MRERHVSVTKCTKTQQPLTDRLRRHRNGQRPGAKVNVDLGPEPFTFLYDETAATALRCLGRSARRCRRCRRRRGARRADLDLRRGGLVKPAAENEPCDDREQHDHDEREGPTCPAAARRGRLLNIDVSHCSPNGCVFEANGNAEAVPRRHRRGTLPSRGAGMVSFKGTRTWRTRRRVYSFRPMRPSASRLILAALGVALIPALAAAQLKALRFARVIDGNGTVTPNGVVLVSGDTITRVLKANDPIPAGAQVVDLRRYSAIPGMIDVHTHITYAYDPETGQDPWRQQPRAPELTYALQKVNALHALEDGVTTIRDLGASNYVDIALRDSVNRGVFPGHTCTSPATGCRRRVHRSARERTRRTRSGDAYTTSLRFPKR